MPKGTAKNATNALQPSSSFVRLQLDIAREVSDQVNEYCQANGMTKKGFFIKAATDFLANNSTAKKAKGRGK